MRLLFDQNLSHRLPQLLDDLFPGSAQVRQFDLGRADDRRIWDVAEAGGFAVMSLDADFADLAQLRGPPLKAGSGSLPPPIVRRYAPGPPGTRPGPVE